MDLFELLQNDSQLTPSIISDISFLQQNFSYYKVLLSSLFDSQSTQNLDLFLQNLQGKPQTSLLIPFLGSYYLEALDNTLFNRFLLIFRSFFSNKLEISNFQKSLEFVIQNYEANIKFLDGISTIIGQNQIIPLKITLKERFQTIFIQDPIFFESLHSVFLIELEKFQRLIIDTYGQKFDSGFLSQILLYFSKSGSHMSNLEPQFFKLISLACVEFGVLEKLQDCIFKLLNIDLLAFLRCDLENFDNYEQNCFFNNAYQYSQVFLQGFLQRIASSFNNPLISDVLQHISHKLELSIAENFCIICKDRVFDMILAYPESEKLFFDLQAAIQKANYLSEIGDSLLSCVTKRLLIPGVITQTILNQYLNILKVLQLLDRGLIFSKITAPIKAYLLKRPDTLRCIIAHLTEDSENYTKLVREYVKIPSKEEQQYELSSDEDEAEAEKWEVLPLINKKNSLVRVKYQESDLVSVLVDLYGSQEAFLNEYQIMLAEKLLCAKEYSIDEEIKNIELLKLRFGENNLQSCNIIVKDVKESKKIDQNLHAKYDKSQTITFRQNQDLLTLDKLHAMFASKGYWPINYEYQNALKVPIGLNQVFEEYSRKFTEMKAIRKLIWHNQLGYVNLSLGFDNGEFEFKCLPIHAILISYLDETKCNDKIGVSSEFLAKELGLPSSSIKQKMSFWVHRKVLREVKNFNQMKSHYMGSGNLVRKGQGTNSFLSYLEQETDIVIYFPNKIYEKPLTEEEDLSFYEADEDNDILIKENNGNDFESNQFNNVIEGLIISMLTTNGPKSAEKIYTLLKTVYKTNVTYPYNESQTKEILRGMLMKQRIAYNGELYSVVN